MVDAQKSGRLNTYQPDRWIRPWSVYMYIYVCVYILYIIRTSFLNIFDCSDLTLCDISLGHVHVLESSIVNTRVFLQLARRWIQPQDDLLNLNPLRLEPMNRLLRRRERESALRASETAEQREERLRLRPWKKELLPCNREGKDSQPRLKNRERPGCRGYVPLIKARLAAETEERRETRLQRTRANRSERLAAETEEQREARL